MSRPIVPVNFDNDEELHSYVNSKGNRAEFIRYCIRKEMMEERKSIGIEKELDKRIERIVKKCLDEYSTIFQVAQKVDVKEENIEDDITLAAIDFFEED